MSTVTLSLDLSLGGPADPLPPLRARFTSNEHSGHAELPALPPRGLDLLQTYTSWATRARDALAQAGWAGVEARLLEDLQRGWRPRVLVEATDDRAAVLPVECLPLGLQGPPLVAAPGESGARVVVQHRVPGLQSYLEPERRGAPRGVLLAWSEAPDHDPVQGAALAERLQEVLRPRGVPLRTWSNPDVHALAKELAAHPEVDTLLLLAHGGAPGRHGPATWLGLDAPGPTPAPELVEALGRHRGRLARVGLLSCDSGDRAHGVPGLLGLARALHGLGLDAVLASRWKLGVGAAHALAAAWLQGQLDGLDAAEALAQARHAAGIEVLRDRLGLQVYQHAGPPPPDPQAVKQQLDRAVADLPWLSEKLGFGRHLSEVEVRVEVCARDPQVLGEPRWLGEDRPLRSVLGPPRGRWVMLGEPGSGKTTLLRQLTRVLCAEARWLPMLLHAEELLRADRALVQERAERQPAQRAVEDRWGEAAGALWRGWPPADRVLLVDGLDEVAAESGDAAALKALVERVSAELGPSSLIVAGRPEGYLKPWPGFDLLHLRPLREQQQARLLDRLGVPPAQAHAALGTLRADARLQRVAWRPLLLTLAALLLREHPDEPLPRSRARLYKHIVDVLLHRSHRPDPADQPHAPDEVERALVHLAPRLRRGGPGPWALEKVRQALREDPALLEDICKLWPGRDPVSRFLAETSREVGILTQQGEGRYGFAHASLGEYLASRALAGDPALLAEAVEAGVADPGRWAETLALTVGQLPAAEADALVRGLVARGEAAKRLLWAVLADAEGLSGGTVEGALGLERGWDRWEARQTVIEEIPALVGDAIVAVRLLDRVRQGTRDGNDLYWIRETLRALVARAGGSEELKAEGEAAIGRLFDHIPGREEARAAVEETLVRIPAGSFVMGDDESKFIADKPAHLVEIVRDFRLMKVPVTWALYLRFDPGHVAAQEDFGGKLPKGAAQDQVPVYRVTWYAARMFAEWVWMRLPAEAEWEYACRGQREPSARRTRYWSGDSEEDLARVGWYGNLGGPGGNSGGHPHPVPHPEANPFGLHDMHGNVWEWCLDPYQENTYKARRRGVKLDPWGKDGVLPTLQVGNDLPQPADPADRGVWRVVRGGSWSSGAGGARAASRGDGHPTYTNTDGRLPARRGRAAPARPWILDHRGLSPVGNPATNDAILPTPTPPGPRRRLPARPARTLREHWMLLCSLTTTPRAPHPQPARPLRPPPRPILPTPRQILPTAAVHRQATLPTTLPTLPPPPDSVGRSCRPSADPADAMPTLGRSCRHHADRGKARPHRAPPPAT